MQVALVFLYHSIIFLFRFFSLAEVGIFLVIICLRNVVVTRVDLREEPWVGS